MFTGKCHPAQKEVEDWNDIFIFNFFFLFCLPIQKDFHCKLDFIIIVLQGSPHPFTPKRI